jgi:hypothetical protein
VAAAVDADPGALPSGGGVVVDPESARGFAVDEDAVVSAGAVAAGLAALTTCGTMGSWPEKDIALATPTRTRRT